MFQTKKILVPVDFNDESLNIALNHAVYLAKKFSLDIYLLHVVEESGFFTKFFSIEDNTKITKQLELKLKEIAVETAKKYGVTVVPMFAQGRVSHKIEEIARLLDVSFVLIAASNHSEDDAKSVGAIASKLIRISSVPLLIIRNPKTPASIKNILLPIDLVPTSRELVAETIHLAKLSTMKITLIAGVWGNEEELIPLENKTTYLLRQIQEYIKAEGIECNTVFYNALSSEKDYHTKLCEYLHNAEIHLVIASGRDESSPEYFVSSNTQHLMRCSPVPVMSIIPQKGGISFATGRI